MTTPYRETPVTLGAIELIVEEARIEQELILLYKREMINSKRDSEYEVKRQMRDASVSRLSGLRYALKCLVGEEMCGRLIDETI